MARKSNANMPTVKEAYLYTNDAHNGIRVDSSAWLAWLETHAAFYVEMHDMATYSMRKEKRRNGFFWYACKRVDGKLHRRYVGHAVSLAVLRGVHF